MIAISLLATSPGVVSAQTKGGSTNKAAATKQAATAKSGSTAPGAAAKPAAKSTKRRTVRRAPQHNYQQKPTPERYREIQQALATKGYSTPVDGVWGPESTEALKKFQADQKLAADGKLTSLTLIGLGLGPKGGGSTPSSAAPAPATAPAAEPAPPQPRPAQP